MAFLHGVEVVEVDAGARPVRTVDTGVIGLVGTAEKGPVNIPTLVAGSRREAVETFGAAGGKGTIPAALAGIFDQVGAKVVVVNVLKRTEVDEDDVQFAAGKLQLGAGTPPFDVKDLETAEPPALCGRGRPWPPPSRRHPPPPSTRFRPVSTRARTRFPPRDLRDCATAFA